MEKDLDEKLKSFSFLVMEDAEKKSEQLLKNAEEKTTKFLESKETEFLTEAYKEIQKCIQQYRKEDNEKVLYTEIEAKKELLLKREEIINEVFESVKDKILKFMQDEQYTPWILNISKKALKEVGKGNKTVYIRQEDLRFKDEIINSSESMSDKITVEVTDDIDFLGGVKVYNQDRKVAVDYSFKELLDREKNEFLQTSGLTLN